MRRALPVLLLVLAASCAHQLRPCECRLAVPEARLAPHKLDDRAEMKRYLAEFPADQYQAIQVPETGVVYLDDIRDSIKDQLRTGEPWEEKIALLMAKHVRPGSTVIDVGAHIGTHTLRLARLVGEHGRVYAFEPQKKIFRELTVNIAANHLCNVVPLRYAVGDQEGLITMNPATPGNEGGTAIGAGGDQAELRTLDSFGFRDVSLIKIDVEDFEDEVLAGARQTITAQHPFLIVEIQAPYDYNTADDAEKAKIDATKKRIEDMGYQVRSSGEAPWDYYAVPTGR